MGKKYNRVKAAMEAELRALRESNRFERQFHRGCKPWEDGGCGCVCYTHELDRIIGNFKTPLKNSRNSDLMDEDYERELKEKAEREGKEEIELLKEENIELRDKIYELESRPVVATIVESREVETRTCCVIV